MDSHGVLNDMRDKNPKTLNTDKTNFLSTVRKETRDRFKPTKLTNKNEFRALVLRNDTMSNLSANSRNQAAFVAFGVFSSRQVFVTATIPEMFGHLPKPKNADDHATIDLYPKFGCTIDEIPAARSLQPGDIIRVGFEDVRQRTNPVIYGVFKGGKDTERVDIYGECPPGEEATPNTQPGRVPQNQPAPSTNPDPCADGTDLAATPGSNDPEAKHLGIDFEPPPVSCGPELFESVFGVPPGAETGEDKEEFDILVAAIQGKRPPTLKAGMHSLYYRGRRTGKVEMIAVPEPYATKGYGIVLPKERWPQVKQMLDDMYADFWYPRNRYFGPGSQGSEGVRIDLLKTNLHQYNYKLLQGKYPGVPYPSNSINAKRNRKKGFTAGCINSAFRSRAEQAYLRVKFAKIGGQTRPDNLSVSEWSNEIAKAIQAGRISGPTRNLNPHEKKLIRENPESEQAKLAATLGGKTKRFESLFDFIMNARSTMFKPYAGPPGHGAHQTGAAIDFNGFKVGSDGPNNNEAGKQMYRWMCRNAIFYGFVRTVESEEWHWENLNAREYPRFALYNPNNFQKEGYLGPPVSNVGTIKQNSEEYVAWADKTRFAFVGKHNGKWHGFGRDPIGSVRSTKYGANTYGKADNGYNWTDLPTTDALQYPDVIIPDNVDDGLQTKIPSRDITTPKQYQAYLVKANRQKLVIRNAEIRKRAKDQLKSGNLPKGSPGTTDEDFDQYNRPRRNLAVENPTFKQIERQAQFIDSNYEKNKQLLKPNK